MKRMKRPGCANEPHPGRNFDVCSAAFAVAQKAQQIQKQVDEVQIQLKRRENRRLGQHVGIARIVLIEELNFLGVVSGAAQKTAIPIILTMISRPLRGKNRATTQNTTRKISPEVRIGPTRARFRLVR